MKRIALTLLAFALTGAMAFADDATKVSVTGSLISGIQITNNSSGTTYKLLDNNDPQAGYRGVINVSAAGANFGVNLGVQANNGAYGDNGSWAWVSPLAGLKISAGTGNDNPLGDLDNVGSGDFSGTGVTATYAMNGLVVGAEVSPAVAGAGSAQVRYGAGYAIDKVATVHVHALTTGSGADSPAALDVLRATFSVSAVPGLTLNGGYNSTTMSATAATVADVTVGYAITPAFSAQAILTDTLTGTANIAVNPSVSYTLDPALSVGAGYTYNTAVGNNDINLNATYSVGPAFKLVLNGDIKDTSNGGTASNVFDADFRYSF